MDCINKPFFTVFIRACNRPISGIERAIESVVNQTCNDIEIVIAVDKATEHPEGNIFFANGQFDRYKDYLNGLYIVPLDDDGFYINKDFLRMAKKSIVQNDFPGCLIVRNKPATRPGMRYEKLPCPHVWDIRFEDGERPVRWCGNGGNWIVKNDVFKKSARKYKVKRGGDWFFMTHVCSLDIRIVRCDIIGQSHLKRSYGKQYEMLDWDKLARKYKFKQQLNGNLMRRNLWAEY